MTERTTSILVIEDEYAIAVGLRDDLAADGYDVEVASDGAAGERAALEARHDLILLDLMLPKKDGFAVCRAVRAAGLRTPIIVLTARAQEVDKVLGLELGADDYVTKPFSPRELVARVRAVLRRAFGAAPARPHEFYQRGRLRVDFDTYQVFLDGQEVRFSLREFELLAFLARHPNRVFGRGHLQAMRG